MDAYLQKLVSFKNTSEDVTSHYQVLEYLAGFLKQHGFYLAQYDYNGYRSIVATLEEGYRTPKVMLVAHVDVVPGTDDQFTLSEADGKYFGRGVYDMKSAIANFMHVIDELGDDLKNYDLGVMLVSDEEIGGRDGVKMLVKEGYRPGVCILPDGGQNWNIETLAKGVSFGKITVTGKAAHGSRPWEGDSAILRLVNTLHDVAKLFPNQDPSTSTINIGTIKGGEALNQIPTHASATIDIRYADNNDYKRLETKIHEICAHHGAEFVLEFVDPVCITNLEHPLVAPFVESVAKVTGHSPSGTLSVGGSDARYFVPVNVPCILTHPDGGNQHAAGEWIDKKGFEQFTKVILDYIQKVARL